MKKILFILLAVLVVFSPSARAGLLQADFSEHKPFNAAIRSALMPGWGQLWNEQETKAYITFGVFAVSLIGAFYFNAQAENKYRDYEKQGIVNSSLFDDYQNNRNTSVVLTYVAIGTWLYAVIDAYFTCKSHVSNPKTSSFNFFYNRKDGSFCLSYSKKFSFSSDN